MLHHGVAWHARFALLVQLPAASWAASCQAAGGRVRGASRGRPGKPYIHTCHIMTYWPCCIMVWHGMRASRCWCSCLQPAGMRHVRQLVAVCGVHHVGGQVSPTSILAILCHTGHAASWCGVACALRAAGAAARSQLGCVMSGGWWPCAGCITWAAR